MLQEFFTESEVVVWEPREQALGVWMIFGGGSEEQTGKWKSDRAEGVSV